VTNKRINRRQVLKGTAALGGAAVTSAVLAQEEAAPNPPIGNAGELSVAEKIAGVDYTDAERAQIFDELEGMVDRIKRRRAEVKLKNTDAPALVFDPRLPGEAYLAQVNSVSVAAEAGPVPSDDEDIAFAPVTHLAHWIRTRQLRSSRLTDIYLRRIEKYAPKLECFITITPERARAAAFKADQEIAAGNYKGPLHGVPYALKDLIDTSGLLTTWGAAPFKDRMAEGDATVFTKLEAAGAVLVGKTTLGALAYGDKWFGGITRNPWNMDEGSSGSSAGSASAVAAGLCGFTLGTETLGSIVSPSTRCGATGLRPTFGRVSRAGAMALCWSLDKIGPICRGVEDTALVLEAINGGDEIGDAGSIDWGFAYDGKAASAADLRIGFDPKWFGEDAKASDITALRAVEDMGFKMKEIRLPELPYATLLSTLEVEAAAAFEELTLSDRDDLMGWQEARAWPNSFRAARFHSAVEYMQLTRFRRQVMKVMAEVYRDVDLIISPNYAGGMLIITNYTGHPSLTIPVGMEERDTIPLTGTGAAKAGPIKRVPHTITLWGNMFREDQLLGVGRLLEGASRFHRNRPDMD